MDNRRTNIVAVLAASAYFILTVAALQRKSVCSVECEEWVLDNPSTDWEPRHKCCKKATKNSKAYMFCCIDGVATCQEPSECDEKCSDWSRDSNTTSWSHLHQCCKEATKNVEGYMIACKDGVAVCGVKDPNSKFPENSTIDPQPSDPSNCNSACSHWMLDNSSTNWKNSDNCCQNITNHFDGYMLKCTAGIAVCDYGGRLPDPIKEPSIPNIHAIFIGIAVMFFVVVIILKLKLVIKRRKQHEPEPVNTGTVEMGLINNPIFIFDESLTDKVIIAVGAFGVVSRGIYKNGAKTQIVAIKTLFRFSTSKLKKEAEIASSLHHQNVLSLIGICFDESKRELQLVMPFMENGDLASYIFKNWESINGEIIKSFTSGIVSGMNYLISEDQGHPSIIHRDLAARNCMVDRDLNIKIADFGLSRFLGDGEDKIKPSGTTSLIPIDSAPESMKHNIFNEKSDVWSFGNVLQEMYLKDDSIIPDKVYDLSVKCHSTDPAKRPSFKDIEKIVDEMSANDFEPLKEITELPRESFDSGINSDCPVAVINTDYVLANVVFD